MRKQLPFFAAIFTMLVCSTGLQAQSEGLTKSERNEDLVPVVIKAEPFELEILPAYPNPADDGSVTITGFSNGAACEGCLKATIYALESGEIFYEDKISLPESSEFQHNISLVDFHPGMYFIVYQAEGILERDLLVVR